MTTPSSILWLEVLESLFILFLTTHFSFFLIFTYSFYLSKKERNKERYLPTDSPNDGNWSGVGREEPGGQKLNFYFLFEGAGTQGFEPSQLLPMMHNCWKPESGAELGLEFKNII